MPEQEIRYSIGSLLAKEDEPLGAAWTAVYKKGMTALPDTPLGKGIVAIKKELAYRGFGDGLNLTTSVFGTAADKAAKKFQESVGLEPDGRVGPTTARKLFKKRIWDASHKEGVPALYLCKQLNLESGFDPAAVGYVDPRDRGLAQINSFWHPEVSDDEAFDPSFSIPWAAEYFGGNLDALGDVDAALAAHNVGRFYAKKWLEQGKPSSGLFTEGGLDVAVTITKYLKLLKGREC